MNEKQKRERLAELRKTLDLARGTIAHYRHLIALTEIAEAAIEDTMRALMAPPPRKCRRCGVMRQPDDTHCRGCQ